MPPEQRRVAVITGASSGIGRELATIIARDGWPVLLVARSQPALEELAGEIRALAGEAFTLALDLAVPGGGDTIMQYLTEHRLSCGILVNNAGFGLLGPAAKLSLSDQLGMVNLNIQALTELTLRVLPVMLDRQNGGVINIGSIAGYVPGPYMAVYYATKAFIRSFSQALAQEVRGTGVRVLCVAPGPVATRFFARAGARRALLFRLLPKAKARSVAERAWRGFLRGEELVVPGLAPKLMACALRHLPVRFMLALIARLQRPD